MIMVVPFLFTSFVTQSQIDPKHFYLERSLLLRVVLGTMFVKPIPCSRHSASSLYVIRLGMSPDSYIHGPINKNYSMGMRPDSYIHTAL